MNDFAIVNDGEHKHDDEVNKDKNHDTHSSNFTEEAVDDYVNCLSSIFPNTDDNPVEYVYTRDATGRVVSMVTRLKVTQNKVSVEVPFKKLEEATGNHADDKK